MAEDTGQTSSADVSNAKQLNQAVSSVIQSLGDNATALVTAIGSIASAVTASIIGGTTGTTANRLLRSKGTTGRALQNTPVTCDDSGNLSGIGTLGASGTATVGGVSTSGTVSAATVAAATTMTLNSVGVATLNTNTFLQQQGFPQATLTAASTVTWNAQTQQTATLTLSASTTALGAISNPVAGLTYILEIVQDATGGRALALSNSAYTWPGGTVPSISTAANAIDVMTCYYDGAKMRCVLQKAFA